MRAFPTHFTKIALFFVIFLVLFSACTRNNEEEGTLDSDTSYAFGMLLAAQAGLVDIRFNYQSLMEGFRDYNEGEETRFDLESSFEMILAALSRAQADQEERMWIDGERNREAGEAYLAQNRMRDGVNITQSGLQFEVITQGTGPRPGPMDVVSVHYEGSLIDGTVFDSSYRLGIPAELPLNGVIPGWSEGVQLMNEGSTYRFVIPSDLAYGPPGAGAIPPNSTLIFRVELISINR